MRKNLFTNLEHYLILIIFPIMCLLILGMTFSRITGVATDHFLWAEEAARYLMIWMAFLAAILAAKSNSHFRMTALTGSLKSPVVRKAVIMVANLCSIAIMIVLLVYGYRLIMRQVASGQLSPVIMMPMWIPYLAIPVGLLGMLCHTLHQQFRLMRGLEAVEPAEGERDGEELP